MADRGMVLRWDGAEFKMDRGSVLICKPSAEHGWFADTFTRYQQTFMETPELLRLLASLIEASNGR